jgi:hypothetical protein
MRSKACSEIANTHTFCIRRVHDRILMDDALAGGTRPVKTRDRLVPILPSSRTPFRYLHCCGVGLHPEFKQKHVQLCQRARARSSGHVKAFPVCAREQYGADSSEH